MLFADVIVGRRTKVEQLTYAVPAKIIPYIRVGSLVSVPVRRQTVEGTVVAMRTKVPTELRSKLKDIQAIDKEGLGFDERQIATIHVLSEHYGASLGEVAYHALKYPHRFTNHEISKNTVKKPVVLTASWPERKEYYQRLLTDYENDKRVLLLFAVDSYKQDFLKSLDESLVDRVKIIKDTVKSQRELSELLNSNSNGVVVGSSGEAFFPLRPGDVLIVDQPWHAGARQQRRPYMGLAYIATARASREKVNLLFGADTPHLSFYSRLKEGRWRTASSKQTNKEITIIERKGSGDLFMSSFEDELSDALAKKEKVLVYGVSRGWSAVLYCTSCKNVVICPKCTHVLSVEAKRNIICRFCGYSSELSPKCTNCHKLTLVALGEGVAQIRIALQKKFPDATVSELSSDSPEFDSSADITVATEKVLTIPDATFDRIFVASVDRLLFSSEVDYPLQLLNQLFQLRWRSPSLTVQTYFPEHELWSAVSSGKYTRYLDSELDERRQYKLPPFGVAFRVLGSDSSLERLTQEASNVERLLEAELPEANVSGFIADYKLGPNHRGHINVFATKSPTKQQKEKIRSALHPAWHLLFE